MAIIWQMQIIDLKNCGYNLAIGAFLNALKSKEKN